MPAPKPKKIPKILEAHEDLRTDNYYWLRDDTRKNPEILSYLEEENKYCEEWFVNGVDYRKEIYDELVNSIPKEEISLKIKKNDFYYFSKMKSDEQYPVYFREKESIEEEILNVNELGKDLDYYQISGVSPSPNNNIIAYGEDKNGRREYTVKFKDLRSDSLLIDELQNTSGNISWGSDEYIYYALKDPKTLISNKVFRHKLGESQKDDFLIYEELDDQFNLSISKSRTDRYIYINSRKTESNEIWIIDLENIPEEPKCLLERSDKHLYYVEYTPESFYALSNKNDRINFCLLNFKKENFGNYSDWKIVLEHNDQILL